MQHSHKSILHSFDATSMGKIALAAGVSKRTVYNHFPSKDDLFDHIRQELWDSSAALQAVRHAPNVGLRTQLLKLLSQKMALLQDHYFLDLARVAIAEGFLRPERARDMMEQLADKEGGMTAWIRAAMEHGKLKPLDAAAQKALAETTADMFLAYYAT